MNPCARTCCWTPFSCATARTCNCHTNERAPTSRNNGGTVYRDPTAQQAVGNVMKERKPR